jgi:D-glycero-D-manno-heptose 1,7-bisphosphate phosphatase
MKHRAVFLDRDATLVRSFPGRPANLASELELLPGVADGIKALHDAGLLLICLTNQAGIALGYMEPEEMSRMIFRLDELLINAGSFPLKQTYWCAHAPRDLCACRKPAPGLYFQAAADLDIDLSKSYAVGDMATDMDAAVRAGICTKIMVRSDMSKDSPFATATVGSLLEAAKIIVQMEARCAAK